jgi:probable phosphoglycerate mutase
MTVIHLARHGQTAWHADNRYTGSSDIALDQTGLGQAARLGRWAAGAKLSGLACSNLRRATSTAEPAAALTGLTPHVDPRLRELDFGLAEGRTLVEIRAERPDVAARFEADPAADPFPGGEAPADAVARAMAALAELSREHAHGSVLVVAHSTLIRLLVCAVLEVPLGHYRRKLPRLSPASRTELEFRDASVALLAYNVPVTAGYDA